MTTLGIVTSVVHFWWLLTWHWEDFSKYLSAKIGSRCRPQGTPSQAFQYQVGKDSVESGAWVESWFCRPQGDIGHLAFLCPKLLGYNVENTLLLSNFVTSESVSELV